MIFLPNVADVERRRKNKTGRLKPRLYKRNPDGARVEGKALKLPSYLQSAEADIVCVDAVSTAVLS